MQENIKSYFFIKNLFDLLLEKNKLEIAKYDKRLQKKIDISLINYKFFSGKYLIMEPNRKGKDFYGYDDKLRFEGEYLNGKRNGKGKEYDYDGKLKFEGNI